MIVEDCFEIHFFSIFTLFSIFQILIFIFWGLPCCSQSVVARAFISVHIGTIHTIIMTRLYEFGLNVK